MLYLFRFFSIKKTSLSLTVSLFAMMPVFAQFAPIEMGKISPEDLQMTTYEPDTSAAALVLCDFGRISVEDMTNDYKCRYYRHRRVKILTETGFEYANVQLSYYSKDKLQQMGRVRANIFSPDGTVYSLDKKEFFEDKGEYWTRVKFAFPNVQVGSVIEYEYTVINENIHLLPDWYFQEEIPVRWNELQFNFHPKLSYTYILEINPGMVQRVEGDITYLEGESGQMTVEAKRFLLKNSVAMKEEPYITTMNDYKARVRFQLDSYLDSYMVKQQVLSSWEEIVKDLESQPFFGPQYLRKRFTKKINEALQPHLVGLKTDKQKAKAIYKFLAENMVWDGTYQMFTEENLDEIWEKKQGTSADINFMMISLLRQNELEAHPMLTSTRGHGKMYEKYPMLSQFNHTMVWALLDGKPQILDVPTKTRAMRLPTISALNNRGLVIKNPEALWVDVLAPTGSDAFVYEVALDESGVLAGTMNTKYTAYNANPERSGYVDFKDGRHWESRLEDFPAIAIEVVELKNYEDVNKPFREKLKLTIPDAAIVSGDFIYFSPILYSGFKENDLKLEKRFFPVDMAYPIQEQIVMKLTIPDGYAIEELPEVANLALPNDGGKFRYAVSKKNEQTIQLVTNFKLNKYQFTPDEYPSLREMFDLVAEKYGEQIVLKKK